MSLPYDMGNAGDLVKHGLLAEFTRWWCGRQGKTLRFLDPFAGRPWTSTPKGEVTRRIQALGSCALRTAQLEPTSRYYGSAFVVLNAAVAAGYSAQVLVSDSDPEARGAFQEVDLRFLGCPGFSPSDGFSILDADFQGDLVLLDPFADFLPKRASEMMPKVAAVSRRVACVLFVLNLDPNNRVGRRYAVLRATHLPFAWSLQCPKLPDCGIGGESRYEVEVLLVWQQLAAHPARDGLRDRLSRYAASLSEALDCEVVFSTSEAERT